jgi:hypothetical protein
MQRIVVPSDLLAVVIEKLVEIEDLYEEAKFRGGISKRRFAQRADALSIAFYRPGHR